MKLADADNLGFSYTGSSVPIFKNLTFSVESNDFIILCGSSGCGKTTLLRLLKEELRPSGNLTGRLNISIDSLKIGFVFQNPHNQTVTGNPYDEIAFGLSNQGIAASLIKKNICEMASFFNISNILHQDINTLSGGEKQMVNLASVMVMKPDLLLLDEPSSMLDPVETENLSEILKRIHNEYGTSIILCEHNLEPFYNLSNKILYLNNGIYYGNSKDFPDYLISENDTYMSALPSEILINRLLPDLNCNNVFCNNKTGELPIKSPKKDINIRITNLFFDYEEKTVLNGLYLSCNASCATALAGPNGCGKSTLLKLMAGGLKPDSGTIKIQGNIVYLPQNPEPLFIKDTLLDDYCYYLHILNLSEDKIYELINSKPIFKPIENMLNKNPYDLSGGEMALAAIFKLCLRDSQILILDEPCKSLDTENTQMLANLINELKSYGKTIILSTHNMEFASMCCDRICLLFDGEIIENNSVSEFLENSFFYTTKAARLTSKNIHALNRREIIQYGKSYPV